MHIVTVDMATGQVSSICGEPWPPLPGQKGSAMTFDEAFERLIGHEGGYVSAEQAAARHDPGGETKYGITKRDHPGEDITNLSLVRAKAIYLKEYWGPAGCDSVPDTAKFDLFDMAVNSSPRAAAKALQRAVGTNPDGVIGPVTLQALGAMHPARFVARFNAQRLILMAGLANWKDSGRGWALRVADNLMEA
jgi:lysozyme family protein